MDKRIAAAVSTAALATGAFAFASAAPASAGTAQPQAERSQTAQSGPASALGSPKACKKGTNVCMNLKTTEFKKKGKKYVKVQKATIQLLGASEGTVLQMTYYGGGKKAKKQTIRCQYGLCAAQWPKVNLTYKKGTKVYGKVVKSGVHQGTVTIKL